MTKHPQLINLPLVLEIFSRAALAQNMDNQKLKAFNPVSIYKVPEARVLKAKFPIVNFYSHDYPKTDAEVDA